jgi:hypothetical protein
LQIFDSVGRDNPSFQRRRTPLSKRSLHRRVIRIAPRGSHSLRADPEQGPADGFYDITVGSNDLSASPCMLCTAGPGYDDVTGLGAPNFAELLSHFELSDIGKRWRTA